MWRAGAEPAGFHAEALLEAVTRLREPTHVVMDGHTGHLGVGFGGTPVPGQGAPSGWPLVATLPPLYPEWLGDRSFQEVHGTRFAYVAGAMANGIATVELVEAMARGGAIGFFGAAGLHGDRVVAAVDRLLASLGDRLPWGSNLIHSPNEPGLEAAVAALYVRRGVKRVSASAYMALTPAIVRCAVAGLRQLPDGSIHRERFVFAKISRPEVARRFLEPAPAELLDALVGRGELTAEEARLARHVPVAEDITVEADSGGHTDNRPLAALFPTIAALRDAVVAQHGYTRAVRVGAAGGLGTPASVASAFAMGAAYVLTGSVNQACLESGLSSDGKRMLAQADLADVVMAPAADMFELGVNVQVLRRGTMFAVRARKLHELYRDFPSLDALPAEEVQRLEKEVFRASLDEAWASTRAFWEHRDPGEVTRAERDARHKMALVFRAYLGQSSRWAIQGAPERKLDFQIWCGPAMGAFNRWVAGTFLEPPEQRTALEVALNLLEGAAQVTRAGQLRSAGLPVPPAAFAPAPRPLTR